MKTLCPLFLFMISGLALCRDFIAKQNGSICGESEEGKGASILSVFRKKPL